jgi:hypothetical protein
MSSKARKLANLLSNGKALSDGVINVDGIEGLVASATEINYTDGVTSPIQTQLDAKASATDLTNAINGLGTASALDVGTGANQVVQLDANGKLPAIDGGQLTNIQGYSIASALAFE